MWQRGVVSSVRRIGIGLAAVGRPAYITAGRDRDLGDARDVEALRERTWAVLDAAYAAGIRYVDAARSYGRAEEFLAGWLAARPGTGDVEIGSKWGYRYVGEWRLDGVPVVDPASSVSGPVVDSASSGSRVHEVKDHSVEAFAEQSAESLALLGGRLAVYHVHSATLDTGALDDAELHRAMADLREHGIRVGISTSGPRQAEAVRRALEVDVDGEPLFTSFQSTWNVLEPSVGPALAEAADAGAKVIVKEALANGRLAPGGATASRDDRIASLADELGTSVDRLAIAAVLAEPWAGIVLSGAVDPAQLASNVAATGLEIPAEVEDELLDLAEPAEQYWAARAHRPWA
ncbi:aldo/keto reductase [Pseudonocardia lutea]|uniref:Aldo/keto reductase n=1 Tax=Pseudonocardia lutea TaxID=2172015 RepID=A0ABW1IFJ0_9PSEU